MSNVYLISDTHFAHKNIMKYENRPFKDLTDMREKLILNWNMLVKPEDTVIHLGDFGMCNKDVASDILSRLNGHKILIKGNHHLLGGAKLCRHHITKRSLRIDEILIIG